MFKSRIKILFISLLAMLLIISSVAYANFFDDIKGIGIKGNGEKVRVAISASDLAAGFSIALHTYLKSILEHAGANIVSFTNANSDPGVQTSNLEDLMQLNLDAIVIQPTDEYALIPVVKKLKERGVKVIIVNRGIQTPVDLFIGINNEKYGEYLGEALVNLANGKEVKILETQGEMSLGLCTGRSSGFGKVVKEHKNLQIVNQAPCEWLAENAMAATLDTLKAHPDLKAIFSHSDVMIPGIMSALEQANRLKKINEVGHIWVVAVDGAPEAVEKIKDGWMDLTLEQSPLTHSIIAAKAILERVVKGKSINEFSVNINPVPITIKNANGDTLSANYDLNSEEPWPYTKAVWDSIDFDNVVKGEIVNFKMPFED